MRRTLEIKRYSCMFMDPRERLMKEWARAAWSSVRRFYKRPARCPCCGTKASSSRMHGHHPSYFHPLRIVWLCRDCHSKTHRWKDWILQDKYDVKAIY